MQGAVLINASWGPVIDEASLVDHLKANPMFHVGLDVFEVNYFIRFLGTLSCGCIFIAVFKSGVCKICWFNDQVDIVNEARIYVKHGRQSTLVFTSFRTHILASFNIFVLGINASFLVWHRIEWAIHEARSYKAEECFCGANIASLQRLLCRPFICTKVGMKGKRKLYVYNSRIGSMFTPWAIGWSLNSSFKSLAFYCIFFCIFHLCTLCFLFSSLIFKGCCHKVFLQFCIYVQCIVFAYSVSSIFDLH